MNTAQSDILLTTLNARYSHSAIGLRYLFANLGELQSSAAICEFTISDNVQDVAEKLLERRPKILGIGIYIWNAVKSAELVATIKRVSPQTVIILGGPEVSYLPMRVNFDAADYIIQGEGDAAFHELAGAILNNLPPATRIIRASLPDLNSIALPYDYYSDEDVAHRYIYVEASRGCPFRCEFCLSSMQETVRSFDIDIILDHLEALWQRGVRSFKFIDRTFNLNIRTASRLLDFFLDKTESGCEACFVHFEVIPDHFPAALKERIARFPPASLQLEIGIQTLNPDVAKNIHRNLKPDKIEKNIRFLEHETSAHMHLDLIVGLPGETLAGFGDNLNRLCAMTSSEIQIGILKKLSGTTLERHDAVFGMVYADMPPYDILKNSLLSFEDIQRMKRFARFWDLFYNSGNFSHSITLLWPDGDVFEKFHAFSVWIYGQTRSTWKLSLERLAELLFNYLVQQGHAREQLAEILLGDIMKLKGRKVPNFLKPCAHGRPESAAASASPRRTPAFNKRQIRHG
ncbi:MAG: DUF4080 domain-containing protein [Mariprofundaceae bacterium]|nr:DUF4080 domain-containing protein [Mariprofundaceae bacterium]